MRPTPLRVLPAVLLLASSVCAGCMSAGGRESLLAPHEDPFFSLLSSHGSAPSLGPEEPAAVLDGEGNPIRLPRGSASFADEVVEYRMGVPSPVPEGQHPEAALGAPDYTGGNILDTAQAVTLGQGGSITLRFKDNALVNVEGPDLYIFESGPDAEDTLVDISADGKEWISIGRVAGHASSVDIGPYSTPGQVFYYVRLRDDPVQGHAHGDWPGADIDAVGAVGSAERIEISGEVLFEHDSDRLLPGAASALDSALSRISARAAGRDVRVTVLGHTDSNGQETYNVELSRRRADAVARYIEERGVPRAKLTVEGYGEGRPVAENDTPEGRRKNRRVEILIQDE